MYLSRYIKRADFEEYPGQVHTSGPDTRRGKVTVVYSNGRRPEFENILREDYFYWKDTHKFSWRYPPAGVTTWPPRVHKDSRDTQAETDEENERIEAEEISRKARRQSRFDASNVALLNQLGEAEFDRRFPGWLEKVKQARDAAKEE
jgi:hypothetical protein